MGVGAQGGAGPVKLGGKFGAQVTFDADGSVSDISGTASGSTGLGPVSTGASTNGGLVVARPYRDSNGTIGESRQVSVQMTVSAIEHGPRGHKISSTHLRHRPHTIEQTHIRSLHNRRTDMMKYVSSDREGDSRLRGSMRPYGDTRRENARCAIKRAQLQLLRDCADVCALTARYTRDSRFSKESATFCADVCEACAAECMRHADRCPSTAPAYAAIVPENAGRMQWHPLRVASSRPDIQPSTRMVPTM